jgi:hypothetical protein
MNAGARAILDVKLATGKMTFNQATEFLIDNIGTDRVVAEAEVRRTATHPTISACPLWGRDRMRDLRKRVKDKLKGRYSELFFNNSVLRAGGLPMAALVKELDWRSEEELARPVDAPEKSAKSSRNGKIPVKAKVAPKAKPEKKKVPAKAKR